MVGGFFFKVMNEKSPNGLGPVVFLRQFNKNKRTETNLKNSLVGNLEGKRTLGDFLRIKDKF